MKSDDLYLFAVIWLVLTIVILIAFFKMALNLAVIKQTLFRFENAPKENRTQNNRIDFYVHKSLPGNEVGQARALAAIIYSDILEPGISEAERQTRYEKLKTRYQKVFDEIGIAFPPNVQTIK